MNVIDIIGYIGAFFLTITFIPQTYNVLRTNEFSQIKYTFLWNAVFTSVCMNVYGCYYRKYPIVIGNTSVFINSIIIIQGKYLNERLEKELPTVNIEKN
jgi:uncharacterized protein with PQ loop repeat